MSRQTNLALAQPSRGSADLRTLVAAVRERILNGLHDARFPNKPSTRAPSSMDSAESVKGELVKSIVNGLPVMEREVLRLFYIDARTPEEIGAALALSEDQVRKIKISVKRRIRRAFETRVTAGTGRNQQEMSVMDHAVAVFGDERKASHWLATPLRMLGGRSPAQALAEDGDVSAVDRILTRIEHNIPS